MSGRRSQSVRRSPLGRPDAELALHEVGERRRGVAEEAGGELGVEQHARAARRRPGRAPRGPGRRRGRPPRPRLVRASANGATSTASGSTSAMPPAPGHLHQGQLRVVGLLPVELGVEGPHGLVEQGAHQIVEGGRGGDPGGVGMRGPILPERAGVAASVGPTAPTAAASGPARSPRSSTATAPRPWWRGQRTSSGARAWATTCGLGVGLEERGVGPQDTGLAVGLRVDAGHQPVAQQERQHVVAVDPLRAAGV